MADISIIIVTYNSSQFIGDCLDSISAQTNKEFEVVIIDNNSTDETIGIIKQKLPDVYLINNKENLGFSKAINQGIAKANCKYILCLNDDVKLGNSFLSNILKAIESRENIGAVQPKLLKPDGLHIDTTGIHLSYARRFYNIGTGKKDGEGFSRQRYIFGACAAVVLYRKNALESVKYEDEYFDEDFFCLVEDVDMSWRMQKNGWRILYYPDAVCFHHRGISCKKDNFTQYLSMRNRYLMILKNESLSGFLRFPIIFLAYDLWRNLYMLILNPKYFLKALYEIIRLSRKMVKKRQSRNISFLHR